MECLQYIDEDESEFDASYNLFIPSNDNYPYFKADNDGYAVTINIINDLDFISDNQHNINHSLN